MSPEERKLRCIASPYYPDHGNNSWDHIQQVLTAVKALQPSLYNQFHKDRRQVMKQQLNSLSADELWDIVTKYRKKHHIGEDEVKYPATTMLKAASARAAKLLLAGFKGNPKMLRQFKLQAVPNYDYRALNKKWLSKLLSAGKKGWTDDLASGFDERLVPDIKIKNKWYWFEGQSPYSWSQYWRSYDGAEKIRVSDHWSVLRGINKKNKVDSVGWIGQAWDALRGDPKRKYSIERMIAGLSHDV